MKEKTGKLICPHCGEETVAKTAARTVGWEVTSVTVCLLCGGELKIPVAAPEPGAGQPRSDRLSQLLGGETLSGPTLAPVAGADRFCRGCAHYLAHPFRTFCSLHRRDVDPMGDCPDFRAKTE